jgi:hypothetical protein
VTNPPDELLAVTLARIETKLDNAISLGSDHERRLRLLEAGPDQRDYDNVDTRVTDLERGRWPLPSLALLVSVAAVIIPLVR